MLSLGYRYVYAIVKSIAGLALCLYVSENSAISNGIIFAYVLEHRLNSSYLQYVCTKKIRGTDLGDRSPCITCHTSNTMNKCIFCYILITRWREILTAYNVCHS